MCLVLQINAVNQIGRGGADLHEHISTLTSLEQVSFLWEVNKEKVENTAEACCNSAVGPTNSVEVVYCGAPTLPAFHPAEADAAEGRDDAARGYSYQCLLVIWGNIKQLFHQKHLKLYVGDTTMQRSALSLHSKRLVGLISAPGPFCVGVPPCVGLGSLHSGFFPQSKSMHLMKLWIVSGCVNGCLSFNVALQWAGDLFRVQPHLCKMPAGIGSSRTDPNRESGWSRRKGWKMHDWHSCVFLLLTKPTWQHKIRYAEINYLHRFRLF